ncbi:hypothetical protein SKDZ_14G3880 [Saccharomyces kudriavzevii ZP591]|nr:hypothetical protein SKDZ_14G3880 [Saccharomyces kudriavzevii ZP591]
MQLYLSIIFLLSFVECSYISFISNNADRVLETDVIETLTYTTATVGKPYVAQSVVVTRVSASSQRPLKISLKNEATTSSINSQSRDSTSRTVMQGSLWSSNYASKSYQPLSSGSSNDPAVTGQKTNTYGSFSSTKSLVDNLSSLPDVASTISSAPTMRKITTLLSQTASTSTSILFSSSLPISGTQLNGTLLTSVSIGTNNPLVTQVPSYSFQETKIVPSSLTSNKTIYTVAISTSAARAKSEKSSGTPSTHLSSTVLYSLNSTQSSVYSVSSLAASPIYPSNPTQITLSSSPSALLTESQIYTSNSTESILFSPSQSPAVSPIYSSNSTRSTLSPSLSSTMTSVSSTLDTVYVSSSSMLATISSSSPSMLATTSSPPSSTLATTSSSQFSTLVTVSSSSSFEQTNISPSSLSISTSSMTTTTENPSTTTIVNLFNAVSTDEPPTVFERSPNPMSLADGVSSSGPIQTNKFYTNLIVGSQESPAFVYPYSLWKYTSSDNYGFAVQHTTGDQYAYGNSDSSGNSEYLVNPLGIAHVVFSASNFDSSMTMQVDEMTLSSTRVVLSESNDSSDYLVIPLVQGMGFATGIYHGSLNAKIGSSVGFKTVVSESSGNLAQGILKYRVTLLNGVTWLCYAIGPNDLTSSGFSLQVTSEYEIEANTSIDGLIIQLAVAPSETDYEVYYDQAAGMYVTDFKVQGVSDGSSATYEFSYTTQGESASGNTIIFALPHHESSFSDTMQNSYTGIQLASTTKGLMNGYLTTSLQFSTSLNRQISWLPWSSQLGSTPLEYSVEQLQLLAEVANSELQVSISESISGLNTYYLGKVIDKYSYILLTVSEIIQDEAATESTLKNIKSAFDTLLQNQQIYPLVYDTKFNGLVSSGDWASTSTQYDFGNTYYNDHHFHYGYIIHAAAVIGYVDSKLNGTWAADNKDWVNSLVRDVANPSDKDEYFAQSRMFDWFNGHSWAAGLYENGNGKNEESSSEDYNFAYAMKLWGAAIGDLSMELRGDLMISIMKDSMNDYFYYQDDNTVEPEEIIGNKVSGILFDNIIDYTTYFGTNTEYIHGIHMLPITPVSSNIRSETFVEEEWQTKIAPIIGSVESGWTGILKLNQALFDPADSYAFFSDSNFDSTTYLDNGMSRTWALAFSGGLANSIA